MRSIIFVGVFGVALATASTACADYATAVKADGPIAYWRLNEAAGSTVFAPEAGFGTVNLLAIAGLPEQVRGGGEQVPPEAGVGGAPFEGEPGNLAVRLPNHGPVNDFPANWGNSLDMQAAIDLSGTGDFTVEMWFMHEDGDETGYPVGSSSTSEDYIGNFDLGGNTDWITLELEGSASPDLLPTAFRFRTDLGGVGVNKTDFKPEVPEGVDWTAWHHVVATKLGTTGSVYLDGQLVGSNEAWLGSVTSTGELFAFGQDRNWKGLLDEIALYNKGLTAEQVAAHYAAAGGVSPPIPGDANHDGKVTDADAAILATNWQATDATWEMGDFSNDGNVTDADAAILATHWQEGVTEGAPVPEPTSVVLLASALLLLLLWRRPVLWR